MAHFRDSCISRKEMHGFVSNPLITYKLAIIYDKKFLVNEGMCGIKR